MAFIRFLISLLLIALIASPFATGFLLEKKYNDMIARLNAAYNGKIKFTGKFDKGYLKSTATTQLDGGPGTNTITLEHTIQQGPVIFNFQGWTKPASYAPQSYGLGVIDTKFTGDIAKKIQDLYGDKEAYSIKTLVSFNGDTKTEFKNNPITTNLGKGVLTWQGITGTATANKDLAMLSATMVMPLFEYKEKLAPDVTHVMHIANTKIDFGNNAAAQDTFDVSVENFKISNGTTDELTATNLTFSSIKVDTGNLMNFTLNAGFATLNLQNQEIGPFSLSLNTKNVDVVVLQTAMNAAKKAAPPQSGQNITIPVAMQPDMLLEFLKNKPSFDATIKLKTKDGDIDITSHIEAGGPNLTKPDAADVLLTVDASKKVQISDKLFYKLLAKYGTEQVHDKERIYFMTNKNSNIPNPYTMSQERLDVIIANWVNALVTQLKQQNFITEQNNIITVDATFANNQLTVNGTKKTKVDFDNLAPYFQVPIPNAPATMPKVAPTTTPATTTPVMPVPQSTVPVNNPVPTPSKPSATTAPVPAVTKEPS